MLKDTYNVKNVIANLSLWLGIIHCIFAQNVMTMPAVNATMALAL